MNGKAGGSIRFSAPGIGAQIRAFRSHPRSRRSPALAMRWSPVAASTITLSTICSTGWCSSCSQCGFRSPFLERRLPTFAAKHWACSRADVDWKAEGIRSSALEFVAYSLGFFHDGHRAASDCRANVHALAQRLPGSGRLAFQALLENARRPTWRLWAKEAAIEKKDVLKARGYSWSAGEFGRPKCWYRDVAIRPQRRLGSAQL